MHTVILFISGPDEPDVHEWLHSMIPYIFDYYQPVSAVYVERDGKTVNVLPELEEGEHDYLDGILFVPLKRKIAMEVLDDFLKATDKLLREAWDILKKNFTKFDDLIKQNPRAILEDIDALCFKTLAGDKRDMLVFASSIEPKRIEEIKKNAEKYEIALVDVHQ